MTEDASTFLQHGPVRIGTDGAAEIDGRRAAVRIRRSDINRIELAYGSGAERPIITIVLGVIFALLGMLGFLAIVNCVVDDVILPNAFITGSAKIFGMVGFVVPAWWLLGLGLRRRWYLLVHTPRGTRKILFDRKCAPDEVEEFVASAKLRFSYT